MLDIKLIREDPAKVKENLSRRGDLTLPAKIDELVSLDERWRELLSDADKLKALRNSVSAEIPSLKGPEREKKIAEMRDVADRIDSIDQELEKVASKRQELLDFLPNMMHESVPYGKDDSENVEVRTWGELRKFDFTPKDHIDLGLALDVFDLENAAKASGARFYYLKNQLVLLEQALLRLGIEHAMENGFVPFSPPALVRSRAMYGTGFLPAGDEDIYRIEGEDLCLIGTSEVPLGAMHLDDILEAGKLPLRYTGVSQCFRTEAGSHGKDTKGIFRVHQFSKVEMFVFCEPEKSWLEHERLINVAEKFWQKLEIPYRVVNICTGDLGVVAAKKYDIEAWLPGQGKFREVVSCSNCTGYQARRLNTRFKRNQASKPEPVHTLNSTVLASTRALVAILENYQQKDGSVLVPKALKPYVPFDRLSRPPR